MAVQIHNAETDPTTFSEARFFVRVKTEWSDEWTHVPYLVPAWCEESLQPTMPRAQFVYEYGHQVREDQTSFAYENPLDLLDKFVQVVAIWDDGAAYPLWHGVIASESFQVGAESIYPAGKEGLVAYGLEYLLDRVVVQGAHCEQSAETITISRTPTFNRRYRSGAGLFGNRSTAENADEVFEFSADGEEWSHYDVARYLLEYFSPTGLVYELDGEIDVLLHLKSVIDAEGLSVMQVLNRLIDRRRGLAWSCRTTGSGIVSIYISTALEADVQEGDFHLPANPHQHAINLDDSRLLDTPVITLSTMVRYDRVVVQGAYIKSCFSVRYGEGTLEKVWTSAQETAYKAASAGADGYSGLSDDEKSELNDLYRGSDALSMVFSQFRVPRDWDWLAPFGDTCAPSITKDGELDFENPQSMWAYGRPFLRWLPLEEGKDYSASPVVDNNDADREPELRRPFVLVRYNSRWWYADRLAAGTDGDVPNGRLRMLDREMGFAVDFSASHMLASGHWSGAEPTNVDPALDWQQMLATVACETDQRLSVEVETASAEASGRDKTLVISVPDAELWDVAPGTVVDITSAGGFKSVHHEGITIRDDSARLRAVAALAKTWYGRERAAVRITKKRVENLPRPGSLLRAVSSSWEMQEVNTLVTRRRFDLSERSSTTIETGFRELDVRTVNAFSTPEMPDARAAARQIEKSAREVAELKEKTGNLPVRFPQ